MFTWLAKSVVSASVLSAVALHADVLDTHDIGLAWSATRTGHPCVDTYGSQQAVSYYNEDHRVAVSQRHVDGKQWFHCVTDIKGVLSDGGGHKMTAVAIDKAGYTHVMGGMHGQALKYWRSMSPVRVRADGNDAKDLLKFKRMESMIKGERGRFTYPMFFRDASDELYIIYRCGGSGNGDTFINKLDATAQTWKRMPTLFKRPGSVYNRQPILRDDGNIHLLFMWRRSPKGNAGHTLGYMKSKDMVNWTTAGDDPISLPLRRDHTVAVIDPSAPGGGLLNVSYSLGFDSSGRPVVAYNKFVDDDRQAGSGLYVARYEGRKWRRRLIDSEPEEKNFTSYYRPVQPVTSTNGVIHLACFLMPPSGNPRHVKLSASGSSRLYVLNEEDLSVRETVDPCPTYWPDTVYQQEIAPTKVVRDLTVEMRPWDTSHSALGFPSGDPQTGCFLRWEYGKRTRLKNPRKQDLPTAGMLRLYEVDRALIWPKEAAESIDASAGGGIVASRKSGRRLSTEAQLQAQISNENVKRLRHPEQQETPDWARKVFDEKVRVLKERAERNYRETGRWYYAKYENGDCGDGVWWDEVASDRVYVQLQGLLGGIDKLPNYSPENHKKAVAFWQGWQDEKTGLFHNPFFTDPKNPRTKRNTEGYNQGQHCRRPVHERVVQKYLPNILTALGSAPLYEVAEDRKLAEEDVASTVLGIEKALRRKGGGQRLGNQVTRQIWVIADHIDKGKTELIPDYERLMALLLRRFDAKTGLLGNPNYSDYTTSANNVKCNARIIGYMGLENYPYRKALADSLANAFSTKGVGDSGAIRNWVYMSTLALQQTDHRSDDLYTAIENLAKGFAKGGMPGYTWMALSTSTAWLHWDIASCEAFKDPSVALCYNGLNRPYRSVVGPFGRWVNLIPKAPEEIYGNPGFSWDKHSLRARNAFHTKRTVIDIVPASPDGWQRSTDKQGRLVFTRTFSFGDGKLEHPYLKARWDGSFELYLNDVLVKRVSGTCPEYCGLYVPDVAAGTLKKDGNVIVAKALTSDPSSTLHAGVIDWAMPVGVVPKKQ